MKIDKSKLKCGIWYEDKDGNYIPSKTVPTDILSIARNGRSAEPCASIVLAGEILTASEYDAVIGQIKEEEK